MALDRFERVVVGALVLLGCVVLAALLGFAGCAVNSALAERGMERRLLEIPEVATADVADIAEWWDPALSAIVSDAAGCQIAFYIVTEDSFVKPPWLNATHVGKWKVWCSRAYGGISNVAKLADGPESDVGNIGISNVRDAVRACAKLEAIVREWPHSYEEIEGKDACYSVPDEPWFWGKKRQ